jgi:hypothetical protein
LDNCGNSRANTCDAYRGGVPSGDPDGAFIRPKPMWRGLTASPHLLVTLNNFERIARPSLCVRAGDVSFKRSPYQVSMVAALATMLVTGNGESGFDSGEGA